MRPSHRLLACVLAGLVCSAAGGEILAGAPALFDPDSTAAVGAREGAASGLVRRERTTAVSARALLGAAEARGSVTFNLFSDVSVEVRFDRIERRPGSFSWFGTVVGEPLGKVLVLASPRGLTGYLWMPGGATYEIRSLARDGLHVVRELAAGAFAPEKCEGDFTPALPPAPLPTGQDRSLAAVCGPDLLTDVLVVYTQQALDADPNIEDTIQAAIDDANGSYENSGIDLRLRLVRAELVDYTESGDIVTDRDRLRDPGDGFMDGVHAVRDTYGADMVNLFVSADPDWCGFAFLQETVGAAFESSAFSAVVTSCAVGNHSFVHELGHNQAARHDRYVDDADGSPYDYNHGYVYKPDRWRTIMAYNDDCDDDGFDCTRLQFWSNPDLTNDGVAMGIAEGEDDAADNRKTLNSTDTTVEAFRARQAPWAEAGSDQTLECVDPEGLEITDVTLDGTGSCDPNGDALGYTWTGGFDSSPATGATPTVGFPLGTTDVTLVVDDGLIDSIPGGLAITVQDTTDPTGEITYPADGLCTGSTVTIQDDFADTCDGTLDRTYSTGNGTYSDTGDYTVTVTAKDGSLNSVSDTVSFTVDKDPPTVDVYPAPAPPPLIPLDGNMSYPLADGFTSGDADGASGGIVHEEVLLDGCVALDGDTFGDGDGLLSDESLSWSKALLCEVYAACGVMLLDDPELSVRVTDCGGNTATDTIVVTGTWVIAPPNCN
jgi:hypothetical protein